MKVKYGNRKFLIFIYVVLCITLAFVGTYALQKNSQLNLSGSLGYIKTKSYLASDWQKQVTTTFAINKSAITEIEFVNKINLNNYPNIIKDGSTIKYASVGALGAEDSKASAVTNGIFTTGTTNVKAYCTPTSSGASTYLLIIYSPAKIYAPEDSSSLFMDLTGVKTISFDNFNTDYITKMGKTLNGTNYGMLYNCNALESLDLTNFITSSVTNMKYLFYGCQALSSLNLLNFNTSNVTDMSFMFTNCSLLVTLDVSNFNTEKVTTMENMFGGCNKVTSIILSSNFKTNKVTSMKNMFSNCFELKTLDLSNFDTSNVSDFYNMFLSDKSFAELDLSNFTIKNGAVVSGMLTLNSASKLSKLKTPTSANAITMSIVVGNPLVNEDTDELMTTVAEDTKFSGSFTLSNTSKTYISAVMMSSQSGWLNELSAINTTKFGTGGWNTQVKIKTICFESKIPSGYTYHDGDLPNGVQVWTKGQDDTNISFVHSRKIYAPVNAFCMFQNVQATTITFNNFDTRFTTNMQQFFNNCGKLESVDLSKFNTEIVSNFNSMFKLCKSLKELDLSSFTIQAKASVSDMLSTTFYDSSKDTLTAGSLTKLITPKIVNTAIPFYTSLKFVDEEGNDVNSYTYDMNNTNTYWVGTIASGKIASETYVTIIEFPTDWETQLYDLGGISTITGICFEESVPSGYSTTPTCTLSTGIKVYKSNTKSTDIAFVYPTTIFAPVDSTNLFYSNRELISITFNNFDTTNTTQMGGMFDSCEKLENIDISSFSTENVVNMSNMFGSCELLETIDISSFNTENVINMMGMFSLCYQLKSVDMSNLDLSNVSSFYAMFQNCYALKSININLNTSSAADMRAMFVNCSALENLNFSNIDTSNVTDTSDMFAGCKKLTTLNLSNFVTTNVTDFSEMFSDCYSLRELDLSSFVINANVNTSNMLQFSTKSNNSQLTKLITPKTVNTTIDFYTSYKFVDNNINDVNKYDKTNKYWKGTIASGKTASETYTSLIELPSDWTTQISSANSSLTESTITGICFEKSIPSGYNITPVCKLSTGVEVYKSNAKATDIAFVYPTTIFAPVDSTQLFYNLISLTSITFNTFSTINVKYALIMFANCSSLKVLDLSNFDTRNITNMYAMFSGCSSLRILNLSTFNTNKVINISRMFVNCGALYNIDLSNFNTSNVTNFISMFENCSSLIELDLSSFVINSNASVKNMLTFATSSDLIKLTKLVTPNVVNKEISFSVSCNFLDEETLTSVTTKNSSDNYYTGKIATGSGSKTYIAGNVLSRDWFSVYENNNMTKDEVKKIIFLNAEESKALADKAGIEASDGSIPYGSKTDGYTIYMLSYMAPTIYMPIDSTELFANFTNLTDFVTSKQTINGITYQIPSTKYTQNMQSMFYNCSSLTNIDVSGFDTSKTTNMNYVFRGCKSLATLNLSNFSSLELKQAVGMFAECSNLKGITFGNTFTCEKVTTLSHMFWACNALESLDLTMFNTPLLQDCENMFKECSSVTEINFSNKFNTSNAKYFQGMFNGCSKLTGIDLSSFDTSNVLNMQEMFMGCSSLTSLNVSSFNTSRVTSMIYMFRQCSLLTSLDLSNFSSENLLDTGGMFAESKKLQSITFGSNFTCEKVTSMTHMFWDCNALSTLNLSMFNTPVLTNTNNMFRWCNNLTSITFGNNFNTSKVTNFVGMFSACYRLKSLDLRTFVINSGASVTDMLNFGSSNKSLFNFWAPKTIGVNIVLTLGWEMYYLSNIVTTNSSGNYTLTLTSTWNSRWLSHYATA